jgi:NAD kinase
VAPYKGFLTKGAFLMDGEVSVIPLTEPTEICIDGQEKQIFQVKNGDTISIRKSKNPAKIIGFG